MMRLLILSMVAGFIMGCGDPKPEVVKEPEKVVGYVTNNPTSPMIIPYGMLSRPLMNNGAAVFDSSGNAVHQIYSPARTITKPATSSGFFSRGGFGSSSSSGISS